MAKKGKILVVDDNSGIRAALKILLPVHFAEVQIIPSPKTLLQTLKAFGPEVVLLDMNFDAEVNSGNEGLYYLGEIKREAPDTEVVLFTAYADIPLAVEGMRRGAYDFISKPWDNDNLLSILSAAAEKSRRSRGITESKPETSARVIWGSSPQMAAVRKSIERIAGTDANVLITGENGTGKDVLAREIHRLSLRRDAPMVSVDLGSITETLFESELFGHVKGAFTDAHTDRTGLFEQANGGTIFLDEIGNTPLHLQAKLLRVLQNRTITRVGESTERPIDIRLICATNMDLAQMVREGTFREDLYYRINTVHLRLPPLRERRCDIGEFARFFLRMYAAKYRRSVRDLSDEALKELELRHWSGNVRELQNCIEKAVILSDGELLSAEDLNLPPLAAENGPERNAGDSSTLMNVEEKTIREAIEKFGGNMSLVAKNLGISRPTLYNKLKKYNI
jgi:two-component system, NtrC family, response regulator HydG